MTKLPTLKQMQYLLSLHHSQHFGRAAKSCFIEQSTLSAAIIELEGTLGAPLIEREHKLFHFTLLGETIVEQSKKILEQTYAMLDYVKFHTGWMQGELHIGCIPTIAPFIIGDVIGQCAIDYPNLNLLWQEETTANLLTLLQDRKQDLVILALPYPIDDFHHMILKPDPFFLVLNPKTDLSNFEQKITKWPNQSLLLLSEINCLSNQIELSCHLSKTNVVNSVRAVSLYTLLQLVKNQQNVTILPEIAIKNGLLESSGLIVKQLSCLSEAKRDIALVWRKTETREQMFLSFAEFLKKSL